MVMGGTLCSSSSFVDDLTAVVERIPMKPISTAMVAKKKEPTMYRRDDIVKKGIGDDVLAGVHPVCP